MTPRLTTPLASLGFSSWSTTAQPPALFEHGGQIPLQSVVRNPRHGHAFGPLGQGDSQNPVGDLSVVVEEFVEISHAEKENALGVLGFDFKPLLHRRSLLTRRGRGLGVRNGNGSWGRIEGDFHRRGCRFSWSEIRSKNPTKKGTTGWPSPRMLS